ncbi:MAG: 50S ribosomal protein L25 [Flavobacteriales bacterium]
MNRITLSGNVRQQVGTKDAAQLRRVKRVPCVLYGGTGTVHFSVDEAALRKVVFTPEVNGIELELDGNKTLAMVHQKQFHPLTDRVIHVDFMELKEDREAKVSLSVRLKGQPVGVRSGGKLSQPMRKITVKGMPSAIPAHLEVDVAELGLNQTIHVGDLKLTGLTPMHDADEVVASVKVPKKVEEAATPAAGAAAAPAAAAGAAKPEAAKPAAAKK